MPRDAHAREVYSWHKPEFKHQPIPSLTREVFISPETCPTRHLSVWVVRAQKEKDEPSRRTFDTHPGVEEAFYVIKGRIRLVTPSENVILEEGEFGWIPAGMPHRGEELTNEVVSLAIYGPARSGKAMKKHCSIAESRKVADEIKSE